ncbi:MAG: glycosyltransferase family 2 protein [Parasporobacterium sp.]|nr:glycosyltransferase family 2 protein [Parasporobacterium sp.]
MSPFKKKLVIIPAYNEQESIVNVIKELKEKAPDYDCIVINDASTDNTLEILKEKAIPHLDLASNMGIGGAVQTGYQYAFKNGYDLAVQFDGDGQHDASYIKKLEETLADTDANMVIGSRFIEKEGFQSTGVRRAAIRYFSRLIKLFSGQKITDPTSGFRMADRKVIEIFSELYPWDYPEPESSCSLIRQGLKIREIPVVMKERETGKSSFSNPFRALMYMVKVSLGIIIETKGH